MYNCPVFLKTTQDSTVFCNPKIKSFFKMKWFIICVVSVLFSFDLFAQSSLPWISVKENTFINESSETIIFRGLNASDPGKLMKDGQWNQRYFDEVKSWGSNIVRFPIHPSRWRALGEDKYLEILDQGIAMAEQAGLYVILDWHSIGNLRTELYQHKMYHTTKTETFQFWRTMAKRYGDNSTVAFFELFNEPTTIGNELGTSSWNWWKSFMEELIALVRANGAKNIPLVAGFNWAYDLTPVKENPINASGVAYVCHPYPQKRAQPWKVQWENDWGFVTKKYPIVLTEIGYCQAGAKGAHIPVIDDGTYVRAIHDYSNEIGASYVVWVFDTSWSPMLIKDWEFNTTESGARWKKIMLEK